MKPFTIFSLLLLFTLAGTQGVLSSTINDLALNNTVNIQIEKKRPIVSNPVKTENRKKTPVRGYW